MNSPTPPRLRVTADTGPDALVAFIFGTAAAVPSAVDCGLLAGPPVEAWCGNGHYAVRVVEETETGLPPREWLYQRCDLRFEQMVHNGAIQEVEALLAQQMPHDAPVMRAIGVPEITALLDGSMSQSEAIERGKIGTRQYAKRQFTWFRNQAPAEWPRIIDEINDSNRGNFETIFQ